MCSSTARHPRHHVLVTAAISPHGPPARLLQAAEHGRFELIVSPKLLYELEAVITRPRIPERIGSTDTADFVERVATLGTMVLDPTRRAPLRANPDETTCLH